MITTLFAYNIQTLLNGPIIPSVVAAGGIVYFGWEYYRANKAVNKNREEAQQKLINRATIILPRREYFVACAGSNDKSACTKVEAIDIEACDFRDKNGNILNPALYNCFVVHGNSMKYAGINNNDFIFTPKGFSQEDIGTFPEIIVIRYREPCENKPLYKIRRTWYKGNIEDNLKTHAQEIISSTEFFKITRQEGYKGKEWMLDDLSARIEKYKNTYSENGIYPKEYKNIILSTTFDTENTEIHFSIHPVSAIVGIVSEAYTVEQKNTAP